MAGNKSVSLTVNMLGNIQPLAQQLNRVSNLVKSKPIKLNTVIGQINTSQAQSAIDAIQQKAQSIDKIVIKSKTYVNSLGKEWKEPIAMITTYTDKLGVSVTKTQKLVDGMRNNTKYTPKGGLGESTTSTIDIKAQTRMVEQEYNKRLQIMENANKKAQEWSSRAQNMSKKEQEAIQAQSAKVQDLTTRYEARLRVGGSGKIIYGQFEKENEKLNQLINTTKKGAIGIQSWADNIKRAFVQSISYATSLGVLRMAQQALNQAIRYAIELNKEMVNIQILQVEGAQTPQEINSLAQSFNNLAKEMGATTIEIAQGSVEWLRQGKTIAETQELLKASTMMGKLGNMALADSTEALTSVLNSFKLEAKDAVGIVDRLVAVDNVAATSTNELAVALRYVAAVAGESGVSIEQLVSYIAVMSQTTRLNAEQIGQAMKTMLTRMQDIQKGGLDEEGLGINNVEIALKRVGITLRDSATSFKDFGGILEELAGKWSGLNEIEQANISKSIAGVRQANLFRILMTHMNEAIELQEVQLNSAGLAVDRYGFYLESVEGSANKLKASVQGLFMTFKGSDDTIIWLNKFASGFLDAITNVGGLKTAVEILIAALIILNAETAYSTYLRIKDTIVLYGQIKATYGLEAAQSALAGSGLALSAINPATVILAITAAAIIAINSIKSLNEKMQEFTDTIKDAQEEISGASRKAKDIAVLANEFNNLKDKQSLTADETERLIEVQNELKAIIPELAVTYDVYGNALLGAKVNVDKLTKSTLDLVESKKKLIIQTALESANTLNTLYGATSQVSDDQRYVGFLDMGLSDIELAENNVKFQEAKRQGEAAFTIMGEAHRDAYIASLTGDLKTAFEKFRLELDKAVNTQNGRRPSTQKSPLPKLNVKTFIVEAKEFQEAGQQIVDIKKKLAEGDLSALSSDEIKFLNEQNMLLDDGAGGWLLNEDAIGRYKNKLLEAIESTNTLTDADREALSAIFDKTFAVEEEIDVLGELTARMDAVASAEKEQIDNGYISAQTAMNLVSANASLLPYLTQTANGFLFNAEGAKLAAYEEMRLAFIEYDLENAAIAASQGNMILAMKLITTAGAAGLAADKVRELLGLLSAYASMSFSLPDFGGGGGGSSGNANQKEIDKLNEKKKALQKILEEFKKYIKLQKESLKLQKEEADFLKDLGKKNKSLAELKKELAIISMDTSEEGMARRIELENQIAELEYEIAADLEDRKYDLQMQALDKMQELFEDSINKQIEAIDELIEALTGIGSTIGGVGTKYGEMFKSEVPLTKLQEIRKYLLEEFGPAIDDIAQDEIEGLINAFIASGGAIGDMSGAWGTLVGKIGEALFPLQTIRKVLLEELGPDIDIIAQDKIEGLINAFIRAGGKVGDIESGWGDLIKAIEEAIRLAKEFEERGGGGGGSCFIAGTLISMADGSFVAIEDVKVGDYVFSHDLMTDRMIPAEIIQTLIHPKETVVGYLVINDNLCVTPEHTVCVNDCWKFAGDLVVGELFTTFNNQRELITSIEWVSTSVPVYNLGTSHETHNYFADGYLVHNTTYKYHEGGLVEEHHGGMSFAGGLKTNEVFAKLLKGEYVSTEGQMDKFIRNTLPNMMAGYARKGTSIRQKRGGEVNIKIPIQVMGNLDKDALPAFEKMMEKTFKKMSSALTAQGYKRTTDNYNS